MSRYSRIFETSSRGAAAGLETTVSEHIVDRVTQLVRRYDIGGLIAEGGMAEIVAASAMTEAGVSKRVALKRIRTGSSGDPQFVARFFDEVRLAMQLSHANVVQVFDFGRTEENEFFLAMEFVEGVDLQRVRQLLGAERLPPAEALHVVAQMLRGLDYAHRRTDPDNRPLGIVHLDVKPANVLLSFEGEVKLTDFGVARSRDARRPTEGISGTIPFMSPEQTRGEPVDLRSDVFSAGVVLYALLAGECPFGEDDTGQTLQEIQLCRYRPPAGLPGHERFDHLLRRALAPRPDDRYPNAGAFADAIDELMFAQGWRGGAAALRARLRALFPDERARLNALFEPERQRGGLAVTRAATPRGVTVLSRVIAAAPAPEPPRRQTVVAGAPARRARGGRVLAAAGIAAAVVAAAILVSRPAPAPPASTTPPVAAAVPVPPAPPPPTATPMPAPTPTPTNTVTPAPSPAPPVPKAERSAPAMGSVSVNASPWATVHVNGKLAGTTPILRFPVRAGRVSVTIENPKLGRKQMDVKIEPKKDTPLIVDLHTASEAR
jgi:serine/threonine-protein kinase